MVSFYMSEGKLKQLDLISLNQDHFGQVIIIDNLFTQQSAK